ncbi:hypothetical protein [Streptomyces sp.]|uniref:hypothetical protein n=1 Tax=Streptomyces sp. TaxID=1931 RepID=UPI002F926573
MPSNLARGPLPDPWLVNITVPVSVANELDQMQTVIKKVMTQYGCPTCHSGIDLRINIARDFVVNPAGDVFQGTVLPVTG